MNRINLGAAVIHRVEEWSGRFLTPRRLFTGFTDADYAASKDIVAGRTWTPTPMPSSPACKHGSSRSTDCACSSTRRGNDKERPGIAVFGNLRTRFSSGSRRPAFCRKTSTSWYARICTSIMWAGHAPGSGRLDPTFPNARYVFPQPDAEYWDPRNLDRFPNKIGEAVNAGSSRTACGPSSTGDWPISSRGWRRSLRACGSNPLRGTLRGARRSPSQSRRACGICGRRDAPSLQIMNPHWNSISVRMACAPGEPQRRARTGGRRRGDLIPAHFAASTWCGRSELHPAETVTPLR